MYTTNSVSVLILEANTYRAQKFKEQWEGHLSVVVRTAEQAILMMETIRWDVVFLDHDLGVGDPIDSTSKESGAEAARWIANPENKWMRPYVVVIHTMNPQGRRNMAKLLPWAVVCDNEAWEHPAGQLKDNLHSAKDYQS